MVVDIRLEGTNTEFEWSFPKQVRIPKVSSLFTKYADPDKNFLDIGCGNGYVTGKIKNSVGFKNVYGVDLLADRIKPPEWLKLSRCDVDKEDLPFPKNYFESIHCGEIIEHVYDTDHLLDEIYRVLSPSGICIITTPNLASWINRVILLLGYQPFSVPVSVKYERAGELKSVFTLGHRGHFRVMTMKGFKELLKLHRFKIISLQGWEVGDLSYYVKPWAFSKIMEALDWSFSRVKSLAYRSVAVVQKET